MDRLLDLMLRFVCAWVLGHEFEWKNTPTAKVKCQRCRLPFAKYARLD